MKFEELTSSPEGLNSLGELLGLHKVKPKVTKSKQEILKSQLLRVGRLNRKIINKLKFLELGIDLIREYQVKMEDLLITSKEIIRKLDLEMEV